MSAAAKRATMAGVRVVCSDVHGRLERLHEFLAAPLQLTLISAGASATSSMPLAPPMQTPTQNASES